MSRKEEQNQEKYVKRKEKYDDKRAGQRTRNWTLIFYPEDLPDDWIDRVNDLHFKWIQSPLHDQDFNADGEAKKPHYHTLLMFNVVKSYEQVAEMMIELFGASETGSIIGVAPPKQVADRSALVRYMAHLDNPEKAQYDVADIVGRNGADPSEVMKRSNAEISDMVIAMERYIRDNEIIELSDFTDACAEINREWHTIATRQMTVYFNAYIRSRRHKLMRQNHTPVRVITQTTDGEVISDVTK